MKRAAAGRNASDPRAYAEEHDETDDEASKGSSRRVHHAFQHDDYWPFYHVDFNSGR